MFQSLAILVGGYVFILLIFAWRWALDCAVVSASTARRLRRPEPRSLHRFSWALAGWTALWTVAVLLDL